MKFAICNEIFKDWKLEDTFAYAAQAGYQAVEIAPFTIASRVTEISRGDRKSIRDQAARHGISVSGIHWVLAQTEGFQITHPDVTVRANTSKYLCELVDFCADLGGRFMILGSPKQRNLADGVKLEDALEWTCGVLKMPLMRALIRDVTICFEPLAPAETNFINTAEQAIALARSTQMQQCKVILDVKAMCSESKPIPQIIRESWPHFAYFHANDRNLKGPGFGDVDFTPIAAALKEVGYKGFVSVEVFNFDEGPEVIATRSIEYLKRVFG